MTPEWMDRAACKGADPDWFHPPDGYPFLKEYGLQLCQECEVTEQCLQYALSFMAVEDQYGIYGGTTPTERHYIRTGKMREPKKPGPRQQIITGLDDVRSDNGF
jgi:WhiB family redox-sensing transcriptional regulator